MIRQNLALGLFVIAVSVVLSIWLGGTTIVRENVAGSPGPDAYFPYQGLNDVRTYSETMSLRTATDSACSLRSPVNATSTLVLGAIRFETASATAAVTFEMGKGTDPYATTTLLAVNTVASGAKGTFMASTTQGSFTGVAGVGVDNEAPAYVFAPGDYLNVRLSADITNLAPTGRCTATWVAL